MTAKEKVGMQSIAKTGCLLIVWLSCSFSIFPIAPRLLAQDDNPPGVGGLDVAFLDATLKELIESSGIKAGAFVFVRDGKVQYEKGFGYSDSKQTIRVDPELTVFRAASNGKVFVALSAVLLASQSKLDLNADINTYLREFKLPEKFGKPVTMHHLLTHTGGFEERFLGGLAPSPSAVVPLGEYLASRMPERVSPPGLWMSYSNHGMALAGLVVQDAAGMRFDEIVEQQILGPLKMSRSSFRQPPPDTLTDSMVWDRRGAGPSLNPYPAGSLVTTVGDMGKFIIALLVNSTAGAILKPADRDLLFERHYSAHPSMPGIAYGFFEGSANGHRTLHHTGDGGHHSLIWLVPEAQLGLFFVYTSPSKTDSAEPRSQLVSMITDQLFPVMPVGVLVPKPESAERIQQVSGNYRPNQSSRTTIEKLIALPSQITVSPQDDGSIGIALGFGAEVERFVETEPYLFRSTDGVSVAFTLDDQGTVIGLTGTSGTVDDPLSAERIGPFDDSRLHLVGLGFIAVVVSLRLLLMVLCGAGWVFKRLNGAAQKTPLSERPGNGLGWRVSGVFALTCAAVPIVAIGSVISAEKPIYELPAGCYAALLLVAFASLLGASLLPLLISAWFWHQGSTWKWLSLSIMAVAGIMACMLAWYWNVLGFNI